MHKKNPTALVELLTIPAVTEQAQHIRDQGGDRKDVNTTVSFSRLDLLFSIGHNFLVKTESLRDFFLQSVLKMLKIEQEEQLAAFCVDHLFRQKEA